MVLQDTWIFKGTIGANIRYGRSDASEEDMILAASRPRSIISLRPYQVAIILF